MKYLILLSTFVLTIPSYSNSFPPTDFEPFLKTFNAAYANSSASLDEYIHPDIGIYTGNNPGVMCIATQSHECIRHVDAAMFKSSISSQTPKGDYCEGYPNAKDGFYYQNISEKDLPSFDSYDENGNYVKVHIQLPESEESYYLVKVTAIQQQSFLCSFYFIQLEGKWYIICQNFCDCSA